MLNLNRAMVIGNLTKDPEMRYTPNGAAVTTFTVATNRKWTGQDGNPGEEVEFHDIVAWGKLAEVISPILKKGAPAYVEGRLRTHSWEGQDGVKRYKTEIIAESVIALSSKGGSGSYSPADNPVDEIVKTAPTPEGRDSVPPAGSQSVEEKKDDNENTKDKKSSDTGTSADDEINIEDIPF